MLSRSSESPSEDETHLLHQVREPLSDASGGIQDDIERLIEIAAELFSAIERQIHLMEEALLITTGDQFGPYAPTLFKERLIQCAESLETSLQDIAHNLLQRTPALHFSLQIDDSSYVSTSPESDL